jgi:hypothetical protein
MRGARGRANCAGVAVAAAIVMLASSPAAFAAERIAVPSGGSTTSNCVAPNPPCTLERAVEDVAVDGDEVVAQPGTYDQGSEELVVGTRIDLHGAAGGPRPKVTSANLAATVTHLADNAIVRDLEIENTAATASAALLMQPGTGATAERLAVTGISTNPACKVIKGTLRDSICRNVGVGEAVGFDATTSETITLTLRNVTAYAPASGSDGVAVSATVSGPGSVNVDAKNVIASGGAFDARATGANATISFDHSNYDSVDPADTGTATAPGTGTNQTQPPALVDPASGDFHQLSSSPTIDAGAADPSLGSADIDGEPRNQGDAPDIGADEFPPPGPEPAANGDNFPPDTKILKGPRKRTEKRKAKFQFGGSEPGLTFECSLDDKEFKLCASPEKFRSLKRIKHEFAVRAVDAAGNRDPTPADRTWSIKKKKKR